MDDQEQTDGSEEWSPRPVLSRPNGQLSRHVHRDESGQRTTQPGTETLDRCAHADGIQMRCSTWMERSEGGAGTISKRYTVTSTQTQHGPIYQILDRQTGAVLEADWWSEKWAQRRADWLNWKEENRNDKDVRRIHKKQRD